MTSKVELGLRPRDGRVGVLKGKMIFSELRYDCLPLEYRIRPCPLTP